MLFAIFNLLMIACMCTAVYYGLKHRREYRGSDDSMSSFIAIATGSIFCAYIAIWGAAEAFSTLFASAKVGVNALRALFFPH